jgi:hypothetical protein
VRAEFIFVPCALLSAHRLEPALSSPFLPEQKNGCLPKSTLISSPWNEQHSSSRATPFSLPNSGCQELHRRQRKDQKVEEKSTFSELPLDFRRLLFSSFSPPEGFAFPVCALE